MFVHLTAKNSKKSKPLSRGRRSFTASKTTNPVDNILSLHKTLGNQAVQRLIESGVLQTKLTVGKPNDIYEQEADRVAEQVMRMPDLSKAQSERVSKGDKVPSINQMSAEYEGKLDRQVENLEHDYSSEEELQRQPIEEEEKVQPKDSSRDMPRDAPSAQSQIDDLRGSRKPLPESLRAFFEPRFGYGFSQVRVHTDTRAAESARAVNALAYTVGRDVMFGAGQYAPGTAARKRLLAHELTHVVQQSGANGIRFDQSNEKRGLYSVYGKIQTLSLQRQPGSQESHELKESATGKVVTTEWLLAWALREGLDYRGAWRRITASHEFNGTEEARDSAATALAFRLPSDLRAMRDRDPSKLTDAQIEATAEFKDYMNSKLVWQWNYKMTKEEALLACRLIVERLREGYAVRWLEHAADFMYLARKQLGTLKKALGPWTADELKKMLDACDGGLGIWAKAKKANKGKDPKITPGQSSYTDSLTGEITLDKTVDMCQAVQHLIHELSNLSRIADFDKIDVSATAGDLSRDEFIKEIEKIEYEIGVKYVLTAFDACKDKWLCKTSIMEFARKAKDFEDYFKNLVLPAHKEGYGKQWDDKFKKAYDRKHAKK